MATSPKPAGKKKRESNRKPAPADVKYVLARLERQGSPRVREEMARRYGINTPKSFGVPMAGMQKVAKSIGRNHALAEALWQTGWYEARAVAAFIAQPERVTPALMDRWCRDFDNWATCDHVCFHLFDRTPHALRKVEQWSKRREEFVRRAAFALLASLALHDKSSPDAGFLRCLPLLERAADDDRNFVKKGVSWALRSVGRRSPALHAAAVKLAQRLAASSDAAARWTGKDALRDLTRPAVEERLKARA